MKGYRGCSTTVSVGSGTTPTLGVQRGVKQGDTLSPVLFNAVMDELLCALNPALGGGEGVRVEVLGFSDDLVLLS